MARLRAAFMRLFFRLLYHQFAFTYDLVADIVSLRMWKTWVLSAAPYLPGPRVLEVGHGPGHLQAALHSQAVQIVGLDASRWMSRQAFIRMARFGYTPLLVNGYAQFLPFPANTFHQVVATFPSEYISQPETLAELFRVLVPGGCLTILPVAWITGSAPHYRLAAWLFNITGQAPAWDDRFAIPFQQAGFHVRVESLALPNSTLLFIHASKPVEVALEAAA